MNIKSKWKSLLMALAILALIGASPMALAQPTPDPSSLVQVYTVPVWGIRSFRASTAELTAATAAGIFVSLDSAVPSPASATT